MHSEVSSRRLRCPLGNLRVLSGSEVCKILEQHGFVAVRQHGSHRAMQLRGKNYRSRSVTQSPPARHPPKHHSPIKPFQGSV